MATLLQIMVFLTREIGQKGPKSDIGRLHQGAIFNKLISTLSILTSGFFVMTLTLGSQPRQRHEKVQAKSATWESHLHSRKCEGMNPHTPKWTPTLGVEILMESQIFTKVFHGSKLIRLKNSLYH
jgi:hypothetical protein